MDDGTEGMGCGPQETFRSCADVEIVAHPLLSTYVIKEGSDVPRAVLGWNVASKITFYIFWYVKHKSQVTILDLPINIKLEINWFNCTTSRK